MEKRFAILVEMIPLQALKGQTGSERIDSNSVQMWALVHKYRQKRIDRKVFDFTPIANISIEIENSEQLLNQSVVEVWIITTLLFICQPLFLNNILNFSYNRLYVKRKIKKNQFFYIFLVFGHLRGKFWWNHN